MIELKGIATYDGSYKYKNEAKRNLDNHGTEFNKLIGGEIQDFAGTGEDSETQTLENGGTFIEPKLEVITYNFFGKILGPKFFMV